LKKLSPVLPNQPDSGDHGHGQKKHFECCQFDDTCEIVTTSFAASGDVTVAANGWALTCVGLTGAVLRIE